MAAPQPELDLLQLQRWMMDVIAHAGSVGEAVGHAGLDTAAILRGPGPLDPVAGIGIYHGMYRLRLAEALDIDFPLLKAALGADAFEDLCEAYIAAQPSRSFTLSRYGDGLPAFVELWRRREKRGAWLEDLTQFELEQTLAIQSPGSPAITPADLAAIAPDAWDQVRLVPSPSLRLMTADYDLVELSAAHRADEKLVLPPKKRKTRIAFVYRDKSIERALGPRQFLLLEALKAGRPMATSIEAAYKRPTPEAAAELQTSLSDWVAAGFFSAVEAV